jgi:hypothetical protein
MSKQMIKMIDEYRKELNQNSLIFVLIIHCCIHIINKNSFCNIFYSNFNLERKVLLSLQALHYTVNTYRN